MKNVRIQDLAGSFAENKDKAREIRTQIGPLLAKGEEVTLDFAGVDAATQSFIHALLSELIRERESAVLDKILFKNCNETVRKIITIVTDYLQEAER